jgi:alkylhydroperoxidase family enzyme
MAQTPCLITDEFFEQLLSHFTEEQLIELSAHISFENFRARFNRVFKVGSDGLYCAVPGPTLGGQSST